MRAGKLRHRIRFETPALMQDGENGEMVPGWSLVREKVPAAYEALSARDVFAAQTANSEATGRFVIRHWPGLLATMRIIHRGLIYSIQGQPIPDPDSGLEYVTIMVTTGVNDG